MNYIATPQGFATIMTRDVSGRVVTFLFGSLVTRNLKYDAIDQIIFQQDQDHAGSVAIRSTSVYDQVGNKIVTADILANLSTYGYDPKNRLLSDLTTGPNAHAYSYSYDPTDNRLTSSETGTPITYSFDLSARLTTAITSLGFSTYTYSLNGNLTNVNEHAGLTTMIYDFENRLKTHESGSAVSTFDYYSNNMKAVENVGGAITTLLWDGTNYVQGRD